MGICSGLIYSSRYILGPGVFIPWTAKTAGERQAWTSSTTCRRVWGRERHHAVGSTTSGTPHAVPLSHVPHRCRDEGRKADMRALLDECVQNRCCLGPVHGHLSKPRHLAMGGQKERRRWTVMSYAAQSHDVSVELRGLTPLEQHQPTQSCDQVDRRQFGNEK